jgi:hypothetical protein
MSGCAACSACLVMGRDETAGVLIGGQAAKRRQRSFSSWASVVVVATSVMPCLDVEGHMATVSFELIMVETESSVRVPLCH